MGLFLGALIIDIKLLGRKTSMIILFFFCSLSSVSCYYKKKDFIFFVTLTKILLNNIMNFCYQYTSEIYPTRVRTSGLGIAYGIGKSSGIILPYICGHLE